ncbi:properdin [Poecilia reticulata]|uniref:Complement factor properdin n=1 Tax=Poecilia reticulata TaxID=8081 RepID=A0A3P9Q3T3_POERE|nr:PREDICTED: properdin [Poecilia reticulata]
MKETFRFLVVLVPLLVSVERSECVRCFGSFDLTTGECSEDLGVVNQDDCCQNSQYGYEAEDGSCRSCGPPTWSPWTSWSFCNVLCGAGVKQRSRKCHGFGECENPQDTLQTDVCSGTCCNDKGWGLWNPWTPCSVTCGGTGTRTRRRVCSSPPECRSACTGPEEEKESCEASNRCPVHGSWSSWDAWSQCSGSCITDQNMPTRVRQRTCSNPAPSADTVPPGNNCPGDAFETQDCSEIPNCPVDGNWGFWFPPGPCSVSCGEGLKMSFRRCDSPSPKYGGKHCEGPSTQSSVCSSPCPVHGVWSGWSNWGDCSSSCIPPGRASLRTRHRSCSNPAPSLNPPGNECQGDNSQTEHCNHLPHCPVDGNWGPWSAFTPCPVTCGVALQASERRCNNPAPDHGGRPCPGNDKQTKLCSTQVHCPVDGVWGEWTAWSACTYPWGGRDIRCLTTGGKQTRSRSCLHRAHNGSICTDGKLTDTQVCYNVDKCYLKGTWDGWEPWSLCTPACGASSKRRRFLICTPDYSDYSPTIGRQREPAHFHGKPKADCGAVPDGGKKYELEDCLNVPPCT